VIIYGTGNGGIFRIPDTGGSPSAVTTPDAAHGESAHRFPQFLPDGLHFLYLARSGEVSTLFVGSLDGGPGKRLLDTNARAIYAEPGYLFYLGERAALMARPFSVSSLDVTGDGVQIAGPVARSSSLDASFAIGASTLAFAGQPVEISQLTWFDRSGRPAGTVGTPGQHLGVRLSPDGRSAAITRIDRSVNTPDIWLLDLERGVETRFTSTPSLDASPVWSPDGSRIVFSSDSGGLPFKLFQRPVAGGATETRLFSSADSPYPEDWTPDGQSIVYSSNPTLRNNDLRMLRLSDLRATTLLASAFNEYQGRVSPDGRWLAYTADDSGRPEVYVRPFPSGPSARISIGGGAEPAWRADGEELFYLAPDGGIISVPMTLAASAKAGKPAELFRAHLQHDQIQRGSSYAATADGHRFLVPTLLDAPPQSSITVILNWPTALEER
jgi:Tol biopolymer transport system component